MKISKLKLIAPNNPPPPPPKKKKSKRRGGGGNASKYHLTNHFHLSHEQHEAAVVVADPLVDSALPPNCLEILRMRIKMKIKGEVLRV